MIRTYEQRESPKVKAIQWTGRNTKAVFNFSKLKYKDSEGKTRTHQMIDYPFLEKPEDTVKELWILNGDYPDILKKGEYVAYDISPEYLVKFSKEGFENEFKFLEENIYEKKEPLKVEAILWEDNINEIKDFIKNAGSFDKDKNTIFLLNNCGGCTANKGEYIFKYEDSFFPMKKENFEKEFKISQKM